MLSELLRPDVVVGMFATYLALELFGFLCGRIAVKKLAV
jgi:hypothetical protein